MTSLQDRILSVFIDRRQRELKDSDISNALNRQGIPCDANDVHRHTQALSPALFQINFNPDKTVTVRVEPRLEICEDFLRTRCSAPEKSCMKLHICRHFDKCTKTNCGFPHDFKKGYNHKIVADHQCEHINPVILVNLLRLPKASSQPRRHRGGRDRGRGRGRGRGSHNHGTARQTSDQNDDLERQVDVSFPSSKITNQINIEDVELLLTFRDIKVQDKIDDNENEYCHRTTIQLQRMTDVDKLLSTPIIQHQSIDIKFKRTKQQIDKTSFVLKNSIANPQDKIDQSRMKLYISTLVGKDIEFILLDISTDDEQITVVQCESEADFSKITQANRAKPQLSGKDITVIQMHQYDALQINCNDQQKSITQTDLERMFHSIWRDVFSYHFPSTNTAEVEFINGLVLKQWMSNRGSIERKFDVTIHPIIDCVDEENSDVQSHISSHFDDKPTQTIIKLRDDWALIAAHPKFKLEYKEFIQKQLGGEIRTNDQEAIYIGTFPKHMQNTRNEVIVGNKTNEFMRQFRCETFNRLQPNQIEILRAHANTVAYSQTNGSNYMVAIKAQDMDQLKRRVFSDIRPLMPLRPAVSTESLSTTTMRLCSIFLINTPERISMFTIESFEDRLRQYLESTFHVKMICERINNTNEKLKPSKISIRIKINGSEDDVNKATEELENLFSLLYTKKFNEKNDGNWTKIEEATQVIQYHFQISSMTCVCQQISPGNVSIYYFDGTHPQFGTEEERIDSLIKDQFRTVTIVLPQQAVSSKMTKEWTDLEEQIRRRNDYKKNLCLYKDSTVFYLFGVPDLVKEFREKFEQLKHKYDLQSCQITLSDKQLKYLTYVAKSDMTKLENRYKSEGCDVSLNRLKQHRDFLAPSDMHSTIKENIEALAQIRETTFDVDEPGFEVLASKESERLLSLVKSKCCLEKTIEIQRINIVVPKARITTFEDEIKQPTTNPSSNATTVTIGQSTISIAFGDLTAQAVQAIVVCSSSKVLCQAIVSAAGPEVQTEYEIHEAADDFPCAISGGKLSCKKILFIPWAPKSRNESDVESSLKIFVALTFEFANANACKSIAFPAVGCGRFQFDSNMIAKYMLQETKNQLKLSKIKMNVSIILLAEQQNVYDAFVKCLNTIEMTDLAVSHKIPMKKKHDDNNSTIPFDRKIVKITLISSNDRHLIKCKDEILNLARTCSMKSEITKQDMHDWSQENIQDYYKYCLDRCVIPTFDLANTKLDLIGPKDAIHEAEKYFYQLTSDIHNALRLQAVSKGIIWSVELTPNAQNWEQYSYKLNGIIEDAYSKHHSQLQFSNEKDEICQINFSTMQEQSSKAIRRVRRTIVDSTLPKNWERMNQNCKRVLLSSTSSEYQKVLAQFHATMQGKYSQIIKIERIQNERWYKQYAAHREDFRQRYGDANEHSLFHGCPSTSANQIIEACFNRSFAGVNGVVYGCGVYFHAQASYSHQYASAKPSGDLTMFLASVLIGKTIKGDKTMKVPPTGYDTTTDGEYIFVVYHDAGAYADHLITYK